MKKLLVLLMSVLVCVNGYALQFTVDGLVYNYNPSYPGVVTLWSVASGTTLTSLVIPDEVTNNGTTYKVTAIRSGIFSSCSKTITSITFGKNLTSIPGSLFMDFEALTSLDIPGNIKTIGDYAFNDCTALKNVTVEEGVESIGKGAFRLCYNLTSISLPSTITSYGTEVFGQCTAMQTITVAEGCKVLKTDSYGALFNNDYSELFYCPPGKHRSKVVPNLIIPQTVKKIDSYAFNGDSITHFILPNNVESLGESAFWAACTTDYDNESLTLPQSLTSIGQDALGKDVYLTTHRGRIDENIRNFILLWDGTGSLPTLYNQNVLKGKTVYVKKSVYDNHLSELQNWAGSNTTFAYKIPIKPLKTWTTLCRDFDVDLSNTETTSGIHAYYVTGVSNNRLTLKETTYIPARTGTNKDEYSGVLIKADKPGTTYYYQIGETDYTTTSQPAAESDNLLIGVPADTWIEPTTGNGSYVNFGLSNGSFKRYSRAGFSKWNKAYLHLPASTLSAAKAFVLDESIMTGITAPKASSAFDDNYYTLDGVCVGKVPSQPGIYVQHGQKVVIRD